MHGPRREQGSVPCTTFFGSSCEFSRVETAHQAYTDKAEIVRFLRTNSCLWRMMLLCLCIGVPGNSRRYLGPDGGRRTCGVNAIAKNVKRGPEWLVLPISTSQFPRKEKVKRKMHGKWNAHYYLRPPSPVFLLRPCARVYLECRVT